MANSISTSNNPLQAMDNALISFVKPYRQFYSNGEISLASVQRAFESFQNALNLNKGVEDKEKELYASLIIERGRCKVYSEAMKDYYENTTIGKVYRFFEGICKDLFGWKTSTEEAKDLLQQFNQALEPAIKKGDQTIGKLFFDKNSIEELSKETYMALARYEGANKKRTALWDMSTNQSNKNIFLISKPDGDCYLTNEFLGKGANKKVYSGKHEPFLSNEQKGAGDRLAIAIYSQSDEQELQKELHPLEQLKGIDGIIKVQDSVLAINNDDRSVPIMITQKYITIDSYLEQASFKGTPLEENEKIDLIKALTIIVFKVHAMGKIHRDIKELNILIDTTKRPPQPILIDFESCIDVNDKSRRKKERAGTNAYLSPEYASAIKKLGDATDQRLFSDATQSMVNATTPYVDIWALGLVLFRIYYGKSFLNEIDKKMMHIPTERLPPMISEIIQENVDRVFQNNAEGPIAKIIKNMLAVDPAQRKMPQASEWPQ